jgi:heme/copper-type cytochrome/quinol oxidase subunit 1
VLIEMPDMMIDEDCMTKDRFAFYEDIKGRALCLDSINFSITVVNGIPAIKMTMYLCKGCLSSLKRKDKKNNPPKFAVANNWASGSLPVIIHSVNDPLTYAEIRMATLAPISSVIKVIGRNNKELRCHTMAMLATPKPAILQVSTFRVKFCLC